MLDSLNFFHRLKIMARVLCQNFLQIVTFKLFYYIATLWRINNKFYVVDPYFDFHFLLFAFEVVIILGAFYY